MSGRVEEKREFACATLRVEWSGVARVGGHWVGIFEGGWEEQGRGGEGKVGSDARVNKLRLTNHPTWSALYCLILLPSLTSLSRSRCNLKHAGCGFSKEWWWCGVVWCRKCSVTVE